MSEHDGDTPTRAPDADATTPPAPTPAPKPRPAAPPLPDVLRERFVERQLLGQGGMGCVYLARDRRLERDVAIKLILGFQPAMLRRFELEAQLLAGLEHPHLVRVYDTGVAGEMPYLVLEYVRGRSLADHLARGRPRLVDAARIAAELARGLEAAHRRGIVHRDIKPANVFLDEADRAKLADFGLARSLDAVDDLGAGRVLGTPGYMAPEQVRGEVGSPGTELEFAL